MVPVSFFSNRQEAEREKQAAALLAALAGFAASEDEPVLLAGDLNAHHAPLPAVERDGAPLPPRALDALRRGGLRCAHTEAAGAPPPFTYWAGWSDRDVKTAFDHCLLRGRRVRAAAALGMPSAEAVAASGCRLPHADYPSDHLSLVVEVQFR